MPEGRLHDAPDERAAIAPMTTPSGRPAAEVSVDANRVRELLRAQHPDLTDMPISVLAEGWDTLTFRLGAGLIARMPRRAVVGAQIVNEQIWLPRLAPALPLPIPVPVRIGVPQDDYPWPWSIVPYFAGGPIGATPLDESVGIAFGAFLRALHRSPPPDAPANPFRGGSLADRAGGYNDRAKGLADRGLLPEAVSRAWTAALRAPIDVAPTWLHGDLHPLNVLLHEGRISAVIDWIDVCAGDRATDLASLWALPFTAAGRAAAFAEYGSVSRATLARARGWAAYFAVMHLAAGLGNAPQHAPIGAGIARALADASGVV